MKKTDLSPWLECFALFRSCEEKGILEILPEKHEAYVTLPALHALTPGDDPRQQLLSGAVADTAVHINAYAAFKSQQGADYLRDVFAVHVVGDDHPHPLLYSFLITRRRSWKRLWRYKARVEVVTY